MNKQQKIWHEYMKLPINHYQVKDLINENGYCLMYDENHDKKGPTFREFGFSTFFVEKNIDVYQDEINRLYWRPKSLQGFEHNNGWVRIEGESDIPEFIPGVSYSIGYYLGDDDDDKENSLNGSIFIIEKYTVSAKRVLDMWLLNQITHFRVYEPTEPPIY